MNSQRVRGSNLGVSIQPSDITHDWKLMYAFQVPLPVVQNQTASSLLLGIRGVNKSGYVGLLVAVQVAYETGDPDVFYTGFSDEWRAQRLFDEGWEQPWYNSDGWRPASNISESARSPSDSSLSMPTEVAVFDALSASAAPGGLQSESGQRMPIEFSIGEFAGILIGSILGAVIVGAIGAYLVLRRRHAHRSIEAWSDNDGVVARDHALMFEPLQLSAEPRSSSSHVIPSTSYEGSYRPTSATLSPVTVTQMVSSNANQNINIDLAPPMYSDSETPIVTSTRRK